MTWNKILNSLFPSREKELRTVWEVKKDKRENLLAGTAHFFPYRLEKSLESYIRPMKIVLFEGPLDEKSMDQVVSRGSQGGGAAALYEGLDSATRKKIRKCLGPALEEASSLHFLPLFHSHPPDPLHAHFQALRPWMAFFEVWTHFLKRRGWKYSLDLEALQIATRLGKEVVFLETIEEQVSALEGIPPERFIHFLRKMDLWGEIAQNHARLYLNGNLKAMMRGMDEFPSRCPSIVERRDPILFERMNAFFRKGKAIAFLGIPHIPGIHKRFLAEGYAITPVTKAEE